MSAPIESGVWMLTPISMPITCRMRGSCMCFEIALGSRWISWIFIMKVGSAMNCAVCGLATIFEITSGDEKTLPRPAMPPAPFSRSASRSRVVEALGEHRQARLDVEALLVRGDRLVEAAEAVQRRALAAVALAPVALHLDALGRLRDRKKSAEMEKN